MCQGLQFSMFIPDSAILMYCTIWDEHGKLQSWIMRGVSSVIDREIVDQWMDEEIVHFLIRWDDWLGGVFHPVSARWTLQSMLALVRYPGYSSMSLYSGPLNWVENSRFLPDSFLGIRRKSSSSAWPEMLTFLGNDKFFSLYHMSGT